MQPHFGRVFSSTSAPLQWIQPVTRMRVVDNSTLGKKAMLAGKPPYVINVYKDGVTRWGKARRGQLGDKVYKELFYLHAI